MAQHDDGSQEQVLLPRECWNTYPRFPRLSGPTMPSAGRRFFAHSPSTILKVGTDDGEGIMTAFAHSILGSYVPEVIHVTFPRPASGGSKPSEVEQGLVLTRQPGRPIEEVWSSLNSTQREMIKAELCQLILRMRAHPLFYYGRPTRQPYVLTDDFGSKAHACCSSRSEWDESRVRALRACSLDEDRGVTPDRVLTLERVQRDTTGPDGWDRPVLTHGDLSDRNILVDPDTLAVTGLLDWEMANIMPAYYEYVEARLSGGHDSGWRKELLDVLRSVLRHESNAESDTVNADGGLEKYTKTLAAWDAVVDVERIAQGYDYACYWTFETGLSDVPSN